MESLANAVSVAMFGMAITGAVIGLGAGWGVSKIFKWSKTPCMIVGAVVGLPIGFLALPMIFG
jgi:F0F1-type ATP synthase assembly protein I